MKHEFEVDPIVYDMYEQLVERNRVNSTVKPSFDYLIQYPVEGVGQDENGDTVIKFEGGASVVDTSGEVEITAPLTGLPLLMVTYSSTETRLRFGRVKTSGEIVDETWVVLKPTQYRLTDPRFTGTGQQVSEIEEQEVPGDRVADGPTTAPTEISE